jgi:AraC-like DNA-binding protein
MRVTPLDKQWEELMALCKQEAQLRQESHPKLLKFVSQEIVRLAMEMGFSDALIEKREFRAERSGRHIVRVATGRRT